MTAPSLTRLDTLRALRLSTWEAIWATVWAVLTTGPFQIGFARHLGASDFTLGLLAGLPAAVGLLQLPASVYVERRGERKRFVGFCAVLGRLCWIPILLAPFFLPPAVRLAAFLILLTISSALLTVTVPAWTSWMSDLVPAEIRGRYFGRRSMLAGIVTMLAPLPAGWFLDQAVLRGRFDPRLGFAILFGVGCVAAVAAFTLILRQTEPPMARRAPGENPWKALAAPLGDGNFRRFLAFSGGVVAGQALAGQFFTAWQIDSKALHLPYLAVQIFGGLAAAAGLAAGPLWGYLADKFGGRPILMIASWGVLTAPVFWFFTVPGATVSNIVLIVALNLLSGAFWAAVGLTQFNLLLSLTPNANRTTYVAVFSAVTGLVGAFSPILGGVLMTALAPVHLQLGPIDINNYKLMFVLTDLVRLATIVLLLRVRDPESRSTREVLGQLASASPVPSLRALRRLARPTGSEARRASVQTLGELRSSLAVEELIAALDDISFEVRESAARALGEIGDIRAIPALAAKLTDPAAGIGEAAAHALGFLGDRSATAPLMAAVRGPDATIRIAALRALGRLGDPAAAPALIETLDATHPTRCEAACAALAAIAPVVAAEDAAAAAPRLLYLLSQEVDRGMRLAAARALEALGPRASGAGDALLARMASERDPAVLAREAAAFARLGRAEGRSADTLLPPLFDVLDRTDGAGLASSQALEALADAVLEPGTFYPYLGLAAMARDETVSRLLDEFGRRHGAPEAVLPLVDAFTRGDYAGALALLAAAATEAPLLPALAERARRRGEASAEEALLGVVVLSSPAS